MTSDLTRRKEEREREMEEATEKDNWENVRGRGEELFLRMNFGLIRELFY